MEWCTQLLATSYNPPLGLATPDKTNRTPNSRIPIKLIGLPTRDSGYKLETESRLRTLDTKDKKIGYAPYFLLSQRNLIHSAIFCS